jgi:hypothetical protein
MFFASIRLGFLLATLVASIHAFAATRVWTLTNVQESDAIGGSTGPVVTGYFSYDDATRTISNWNVRVGDPSAVPFTAFTYVPGNSVTYVIDCCGRPPVLGFSAVIGVPGPDFGVRQLQIAVLAPLDGSNANGVARNGRVKRRLHLPWTRRTLAPPDHRRLAGASRQWNPRS